MRYLQNFLNTFFNKGNIYKVLTILVNEAYMIVVKKPKQQN